MTFLSPASCILLASDTVTCSAQSFSFTFPEGFRATAKVNLKTSNGVNKKTSAGNTRKGIENI